MKVKVIPAFLPNSSVTVRLTPTEIANLLYRCDDKQIVEIMASFLTEVGTYGGKERLDKITNDLCAIIGDICESNNAEVNHDA